MDRSSSGRVRRRRVPTGMSLINSFARLKPLDIDRSGGARADKQITGFDEECVVCGGKRFDKAMILPEATQEAVYALAAQPLVRSWLDGYDVDLLSYGQTGSGKTYTLFGPPFSMERAASSLGDGERSFSLLPEHGVVLRAGLEAIAGVASMRSSGLQATLHGSMCEMSLASFQDQTVLDLLNGGQHCYVDKAHHLQGARLVPLHCVADVVHMAAAVETRLTRGTRMNDTSSRSHCVVLFTLSVLDGEGLRTSRLQIFDLMGSERFKGGNAAHDVSKSSKSTTSGFEGIFANLSLSALAADVQSAASFRRSGKKGKPANPMLEFVLSSLLAGSLRGKAITGLITCLSQAPRNGAESFLSLTYGASFGELLNAPERQPMRPFARILANARSRYESAAAIVDRGVQGKYQARRLAERTQCEQVVRLLEALASRKAAASTDAD